MGSEPVVQLEARHVTKTYRVSPMHCSLLTRPSRKAARERFSVALDDVSLSLERGDSLGIIGRNGSGKSTLLRILAGISQPSTGEVLRVGRVSSLLGLTAGLVEERTGLENIHLLGRLMGRSRKQVRAHLDDVAAFSGLGDALNWPVRTYSSGMLLRLGFSVSIHLLPFEILLVDEVIAVGDLVFQKRCVRKLQQLRVSGEVILVVATHNLGDVGALCDQILLLEGGRVAAVGSTEDVLRQYWRDCERAQSRIGGFVNPMEAPQVYGEDLGTVRIHHVRFLDKRGQETLSFPSGEPLTVHIDYDAIEPTHHPLFRIQFHRSDGVFVHGMNNYRAGIDLGTLHGRGTVELHYPSVNLLEGDYYVSVGIWPDEFTSMVVNRALDFHERAYVVSVTSAEEQGAGVAFMPSEFRLPEPER